MPILVDCESGYVTWGGGQCMVGHEGEKGNCLRCLLATDSLLLLACMELCAQDFRHYQKALGLVSPMSASHANVLLSISC